MDGLPLTYWFSDTITGERIMPLRLASHSWSSRMNDQIGTGSASIQTRASDFDDFTPALWAEMRKPWGVTITTCWENTPFHSGVISGRPTYAPRTGLLTLPHAEVGALLRKRLFFGAGAYWGTRELEFPNLSRKGMLVEVAKHAAGGGYDAPVGGSLYPWRLPIHFPAAPAGAWSRKTRQHEFERPWEWMSGIAEEAGGEDFVFVAGFGTGADGVVGHQWVMEVGSPLLELSVHEWSVTAPESPLVDPEVVWDAVDQQTGVFTVGKGIGSEMVVGMATPPPGGSRTPAMDTTISAKDVDSQSQADAMAAGELARTLRPVPVWTLKAKASTVLAGMHGGPSDGLRPGSRLRLTFDDRVLGSGVQELYVVGISGGMSDEVDVEVQAL